MAVRNYITDDRSLLNFHKGDIIRLQHMDGLEAGEAYTHKHNAAFCFSNVHVQYVSFSVLHTMSVPMCVCSGKRYGCIVRKKVMLLEELKRDTPEFGGFCHVCVCFAVGWFEFSNFLRICRVLKAEKHNSKTGTWV